MKIIIKLLFIITNLFLIINITNWDIINNKQNTWYIQKTVPFPILSEELNKVNYIDTKFCNDWLEENKLTMALSMIVRPWEEKEICVIHFNRNKEDIYIWWWFPDNRIESNWNTNCSADYEWNNPFSKFIIPFEKNFIKVPWKWYIIRKTTIKFPVWTTWIQKWCFAFWANPWELNKWEMFLLVVRKINYINISIEWSPYTIIESIKDIIIKNKNIVFSILFIFILISLILEIKKYKK